MVPSSDRCLLESGLIGVNLCVPLMCVIIVSAFYSIGIVLCI
jgi:hypothetical protein